MAFKAFLLQKECSGGALITSRCGFSANGDTGLWGVLVIRAMRGKAGKDREEAFKGHSVKVLGGVECVFKLSIGAE